MSGWDEVATIKASHEESLLARPNVVGVGTGYKVRAGQIIKEPCVVALVRQKVPEAGLTPAALVPPEVGGIPTDVLEVGDLRALQARTDRWRPAPGGVSIGHYQITGGTLGCLVHDRASGDRLILSNNHVLANSNNANIGDAILQPGAVDGGRRPADTIAALERFVSIRFRIAPSRCGVAEGAAGIANAIASLMGSEHRLQAYRQDENAINRIDAALAHPKENELLREDILEIGRVEGDMPVELGMRVRKSGRSTGLTFGDIRVVDTTVDVRYGDHTARFIGQLVSTPMSKPGDSGSLLVAADSLHAVGLLFAGSDQATIYNPISDVLNTLRVDL